MAAGDRDKLIDVSAGVMSPGDEMCSLTLLGATRYGYVVDNLPPL